MFRKSEVVTSLGSAAFLKNSGKMSGKKSRKKSGKKLKGEKKVDTEKIERKIWMALGSVLCSQQLYDRLRPSPVTEMAPQDLLLKTEMTVSVFYHTKNLLSKIYFCESFPKKMHWSRISKSGFGFYLGFMDSWFVFAFTQNKRHEKSYLGFKNTDLDWEW